MHDDHLCDFETSKGFQDIIGSPATIDLLISEFNADLAYRDNILRWQPGRPRNVGPDILELQPSGHMLGGTQVQVTTSDGLRLGYSSDFQWPVETAIQVDALVLDSTYGSPASIRRYSQEEAEGEFVGLVRRTCRSGGVYVKAHRGTLQRALTAIAGVVDVPIVCSERTARELQVYREHGYSIDPVVLEHSVEAKEAKATGTFVWLVGKGDRQVIDPGGATSVVLSAYMAPKGQPLVQYSERSFRVALSNHADFEGTLAYVEATGAQFVLTDNSRGGHAVELAQAVEMHLGVRATASSAGRSFEWGV